MPRNTDIGKKHEWWTVRFSNWLYIFYKYHHLRHLSFDLVNFGQIFLLCSELAEHHCPHPWSFLSFTTNSLQLRQVLFISSLKNSTIMPHFGQGFSKIASKPHSSVLFPEHLLIVVPFSVVADLQRLERCLRHI